MFGDIEAVPQFGALEQQNDKIAGIINELNDIFNGSGINPDTTISGNAESGFSITGGTFVSNSEVHAGLAKELDKIFEAKGESFIQNNEIEGGKKTSKEVAVLKKINNSVKGVNNEYLNLSTMVQKKIQNLDSLKAMLEKSFNRLYEISKSDSNNSITKENIRSVQTKLMLEFDRQLGILQNILKVNIKPTQKDLVELLKKNADFTTLAETLGVAYGDETASDRLALVFTNLNDVNILANKVKSALKELNISLSEYKNIKNSKELSDALYSVFKNFNKKLDSTKELNSILEAMNILKGAQSQHDEIVKELNGSNEPRCEKDGEGEIDDYFGEGEIDDYFGEGEIEGGDYQKEVGRQVKTRLKSSLSKRINVYQKTMTELYRSFMNQVNGKFKGLMVLIDLLSKKVGSEIAYDDDLKDFIKMFLGFNEDISNEKIFYSLIKLDNTVAGQGLRNRFIDTLDKIINSCKTLNNYSIFKDISKELVSLKEIIDTMSDTVLNIKKEEQKKEGSSDFMWTDKLVDQSFSMNNINLIKQSIKKLAFYGKVVTIKENLHRMNKEQKIYQEDYDKLLGKSIGLKLTEIQKEYVENVDRLNDKTRGRGRLLEEHNANHKSGSPLHLPRGLVETIYKLQYEAKDGLYRTLEAIDLYLMHFTENLSNNPEAIMDLNQMLEQTDIIAKWFTKKSVDNMVDLLSNNIDKTSSVPDTITAFHQSLNIPPIVANSPLVANQIKNAFERTKKCIDSIAVLKNIISMFIHLGEKYGNINITEKLNISPNMIYKHLVKYIWVSSFTMGYGTGGGSKTIANTDTVPKGNYEPETGDFNSFFDIVFTTITLPLDVFKEVEDVIVPKLEKLKALTPSSTTTSTTISSSDHALVTNLLGKLRKDIFIIDDKYFILGLKAMIGKIFTVIDTYSLLQSPDTLANIMRNPVRMIIGASEVEVIPDAIELYIRLPLLVEFYKSIFEDGNQKYKNNVDKDSEVEIIAYIPELGTVWSGLIQCIFDESKYIKDGIYSINNMKDIVNEVNKIYKNYKSTPKDKLVRTIVLDLISEINRRYGILKKKDIAEFYQIKKKYIKNVVDSKLEDSVNFDILDENNEYERSGPSAQYVESSFNKYSNDSLIFTDIKLVRDFRNNIYNQLFGNASNLQKLSTKSFNEKIKYYKKKIESSDSLNNKFELIAQAIDQSSNINAYNVDAYILFHEMVMNPYNVLSNLYNSIIGNINLLLTEISVGDYKYIVISQLYVKFNDNNLFKIKHISNKKIIIDYSNLQNIVELFIENIKYMISKFRTIICTELIKQFEDNLFELENKLLNVTIKNDSSVEKYKETLTIDYLNNELEKFFNNSTKKDDGEILYKHIMFGLDTTKQATRQNDILAEVNRKYDPKSRTWISNPVVYLDLVMPNVDAIKDHKSFTDRSILQKYNMLVFQYLDQFYNPATKKIYNKLIDEFANKAMSANIFEFGGIPDMYDDKTATSVSSSPTYSAEIDYSLLSNPSAVLSMTNVTVLRTLLTRTLNFQLPVKYYLLDSLSEVSSVQVEKYKAYLPVFMTYFEQLIEECIVYKKLLDNSVFNVADINVLKNLDTLLTQIPQLTDDSQMPINYKTNLVQGNGQFNTYKLQYHEVLNNIINGSRALINDMTNVLNELNYTHQFGNIYDNFIKNFYNNNRQLPFTPLSILSPIYISQKSGKLNLLPVHYVNSDGNKYIYGTNSILNSKAESDDLNNYLWFKEQIKNYNNSALSTNTLDPKKISQFLNYLNASIKYAYISKHVNHNIYWKDSTRPTMSSPMTAMASYTSPVIKPMVTFIDSDKKTLKIPTADVLKTFAVGTPKAGRKRPYPLSEKYKTSLSTILEEDKEEDTILKTISDITPLTKDSTDVRDYENIFADDIEKGIPSVSTSIDVVTDDDIGVDDMEKGGPSTPDETPEKSSKFGEPIAKVSTSPPGREISTFGKGEGGVYGGYYFVRPSVSLNNMINLIENQLSDNKKHIFVNALIKNICKKDPALGEYSLDRKQAQILNVIDLNVNPINVHALMREIPLVNIYNYAFTFDNIIKSFVYQVNPDDLYGTTPPTPAKSDIPLFKLSCLLQDPYIVDYKTGAPPSGPPTTLALFQNALNIQYNQSSVPNYDPNTTLYLATPKYSYNIIDELSKKSTIPLGTLAHNNKFLRNIMFLVNAQRVIRLKIKKALYRINTNVVSDTNILNMRITDYPEASDKQPKNDEFEITDLF